MSISGMTEQEMRVDQGQMIAGLRERGCNLDGVYTALNVLHGTAVIFNNFDVFL